MYENERLRIRLGRQTLVAAVIGGNERMLYSD
jgi:hypothetical protein